MAVNWLTVGGVIAYPSESVFGIGCDPHNHRAIEQLLYLKKRSTDKGLILVASSMEQLQPFIQPLDRRLVDKVSKTWPGPTTWLLPSNLKTSPLLRGSHVLQAVRVSNHPIIISLCNQFGGPIVSTSANISNKPASTSIQQIRQQFGTSLDYLLSGKLGGLSKPCEIRNAITDDVIRSGS